MKFIGLLRGNGDFAGIYPLSASAATSPVQSGNVRFERAEVRPKVRRVFRVEVDLMNVTVHPGQDVNAAIRAFEDVTPRYFIDDVEVDQATFDAELERD